MEVPPKLSLSYDQFQNCSRALEFFNEKLQNHQLIENEFDYLQDERLEPAEFTKLCTVALRDINLGKNRYDDIVPFDSTRVVLNSCKDNDYINASFIKSPIEGSPQFIAAQGPMRCTCEDFWEMVLQYRCPAIVMLTCLVDQTQFVKCDNYFQQEDGPRKFGNISVITKQMVKTESSLVLRLLEVTKAKSEEPPLSVLHIHYPDWPDHSVPEDTLAIREILKRTYNLSPGVGPIVVHCSAGVGRTGTYCVIHDTIQRILAGDMTALDVVNTLTVFRSQRDEMVQNLDQYFYCHEAVVDALEVLISGYNAENKLSSSTGNVEDVETKRVREPSDETPHEDKRPRVDSPSAGEARHQGNHHANTP